jgi:hypothetical protein
VARFLTELEKQLQYLGSNSIHISHSSVFLWEKSTNPEVDPSFRGFKQPANSLCSSSPRIGRAGELSAFSFLGDIMISA